MELANETFAAAQQPVIRFRFLCRIRKRGATNIVCFREASVSMRGFNSRSDTNETEQQQREHASKRTVRSFYSQISFSGHFFHRLSFIAAPAPSVWKDILSDRTTTRSQFRQSPPNSQGLL
jgi:hypothetical protein